MFEGVGQNRVSSLAYTLIPRTAVLGKRVYYTLDFVHYASAVEG